ncbi:hypothetical protein GH714_000446 [Hevea brasiliensis]|uniref:Protein kinase domain-containing protein n=1 Tax=Hevea brasiliensis TaxID=3981 RepID=A0A6A6N5X5_HEVBR|nr:hypothetical protein GH714_000446 [Hevea brasiliensis]
MQLVAAAMSSMEFSDCGSHQLQSSQKQVLLQLRKHLEYPNQLEIWNDNSMDFCFLSSTTKVNVSCQDNFVTKLRITGDKPSKIDNFVGFVIPNQTLSENFSMDSFVVTLARLNSLRVLSLVSLGIWGPLPDKIHRLSSLEYLDLSSNYLFGSVPPKISTMVKLQTLILDDNFFNDTVPNWFDSLSNLTILRLRNNQLNGPFPSSIQRVTTLTDLVLSSNEISGNLPSLDTLSEIPYKYSKLSQLQHLDMSFNKLNGRPPAAIFSLPNISYLNLASNMLSGSLPDHLSCGSKLQFVDISNNSFTGGLPHCLSTESDDRVVKFGGNCLSIDLHHQRAESSCMPMPVKQKKSGGEDVGYWWVWLLVYLLFCCFWLLAFSLCVEDIAHEESRSSIYCTKQCKKTQQQSCRLRSTSARFISEAAKLGTQGLPVCRSFTLRELKEATKNFDHSTILGEGTYGKLYKGRLEDGTQVAIRCLPSSKKYSIRNLKLRLDLLAKLRHPHLVCLLGHCVDSGGQDYKVNKVFLIYEYVSNGNFRTHLYEDSPGKLLSWSERLTVLIGVAKAVRFLHTGVIPGFFNNQVKTNNILLNEYGIAKLSDYGLSIISEEIANCGESGEGFKSRQMARLEDDVYSFGFILLESLVGPSASGGTDKLLLHELASCNSPDGHRKLVNPIVLATSSQESLSIVISITNKCICSESWSRPSFEDILWNLQYAAQIKSTVDGTKSGCHSSSLWLSPNRSKRWGELFFLCYTPFWLTLCLGIVVPYKLYESFTELEYLLLAMVSAVPSLLIPMMFVGKADSGLSWKERYWVKASVWIIIFSYVGNYFWTHYFFTVLGASYTFPSWKMNDVPHTTFLLTHVCFLFYHVTSNMQIRRLRHAIADLPDKLQWTTEAAWILALAYFIAYLETLAISNSEEFELVFRHLDKNGDGKISPSELSHHLSLMGGKLFTKEAEMVVELLDSDGDGLLGFEDLVKLMEAGGEEDKLEDLREAFAMFDVDNCGLSLPRT